MEKFYNNATNEEVRFKFNIIGVQGDKVESRLVFELPDGSFQSTKGIIVAEEAVFKVPDLALTTAGSAGKMFIESIYKDQYFKVWESQYEIEEKVKIDAIPGKTISDKVKVVIEKAELIKEEKKEEIKEEKPEKKEESRADIIAKIEESSPGIDLSEFSENTDDRYDSDHFLGEHDVVNEESEILSFIEFNKVQTEKQK